MRKPFAVLVIFLVSSLFVCTELIAQPVLHAIPGNSVSFTQELSEAPFSAEYLFEITIYEDSTVIYSQKTSKFVHAGESDSVTFTWVPSKVGTYTVRSEVSHGGEIYGISTWTVVVESEVTPTTQIPELSFASLESEKPFAFVGEEVAFIAIIRNMGNVPVYAFEVSFYIEGSDAPIATVTLSVGALEVVQTEVKYSFEKTGNYRLYAIIDPGNQIKEKTKENNEAFTEIEVVSPGEAPHVGAGWILEAKLPGELIVGERYRASAIVINKGSERAEFMLKVFTSEGLRLIWIKDGTVLTSNSGEQLFELEPEETVKVELEVEALDPARGNWTLHLALYPSEDDKLLDGVLLRANFSSLPLFSMLGIGVLGTITSITATLSIDRFLRRRRGKSLRSSLGVQGTFKLTNTGKNLLKGVKSEDAQRALSDIRSNLREKLVERGITGEELEPAVETELNLREKLLRYIQEKKGKVTFRECAKTLKVDDRHLEEILNSLKENKLIKQVKKFLVEKITDEVESKLEDAIKRMVERSLSKAGEANLQLVEEVSKEEYELVRRVLEYIRQHDGEIVLDECAEELGIALEDVRRALQILLDQGVISPETLKGAENVPLSGREIAKGYIWRLIALIGGGLGLLYSLGGGESIAYLLSGNIKGVLEALKQSELFIALYDFYFKYVGTSKHYAATTMLSFRDKGISALATQIDEIASLISTATMVFGVLYFALNMVLGYRLLSVGRNKVKRLCIVIVGALTLLIMALFFSRVPELI